MQTFRFFPPQDRFLQVIQLLLLINVYKSFSLTAKLYVLYRRKKIHISPNEILCPLEQFKSVYQFLSIMKSNNGESIIERQGVLDAI